MATECNKLEITTEAPCSPHLFYEMFKCSLQHLTVVLPEIFQTSEILQGDGESEGTVRLWNYVLPGSSDVLVANEKMDIVDDENMCIVLSVLEGALVEDYASFQLRVKVTPNGEGCSVNWCFEYGECGEGVDDPHHYLQLPPMICNKFGEVIAAGSQVVAASPEVVDDLIVL